MAFLSQASHLGSLLLPHDAFQEHAAHRTEWSAQLSSKGSERTCIRSGLPTFLHCACTAHPDFVVDGAPQRVKAAHVIDFPLLHAVGSSDQLQNNTNNIKGLAFYHAIRRSLVFLPFQACLDLDIVVK